MSMIEERQAKIIRLHKEYAEGKSLNIIYIVILWAHGFGNLFLFTVVRFSFERRSRNRP